MTKRLVFWHDALSGNGVEAAKARPMDVDEAVRIFDAFVSGDSFIGVDVDDRCVQLMMQQDGRFLVDLPDVAANGSLQRHDTATDARILLQRLFREGFDTSSLTGLIFRAWRKRDA